ncbi:MAG: cytochrome c oxidase accessory protein CcoG [Longimicrobiales bacterium]|nr:cytochrome c oxidase accessory protein CcoG [Longimicrobiales bacterium]
MLGFTGSREWVYPQSIDGAFMRLRRWTFAGLHALLLIAPWITVNGHPLLLIDIPARRVFLSGLVFTAADTIFLALLLFFAAFSLFFFTSIFGRIWCGYACPQTVFLETWIRPVELWIEGERTTRRRRDAAGWSFDRAWRKAVKWTVFLAVSAFLAMAMVSLFVEARELWTGAASPTAYAFVGIFTAMWYLDFVWFREQFCNYLCPYARFQSALTDDESLLISYDEPRGEPREKGREAALDGRCIACRKCVVVCPQGIDIRDGFQLECIQCARCVDACTSVMEPLGHETLVRYSSLAADEGRARRTLRPRTVVYGGLLTTLAAAAIVLALGRVPFEATVNRAPGTLFTMDADGYVRNTYMLKITDKAGIADEHTFEIALEGLPNAEVITQPVVLPSLGTRTVPLVVRMRTDAAAERTFTFEVVVSGTGGVIRLPTTFKTGALEEE